jgi:hypothetical protein
VKNQAESTRPSSSQTSQDLVVRERIIGKENEVSCSDAGWKVTWPNVKAQTGNCSQYLAMHSSASRTSREWLCWPGEHLHLTPLDVTRFVVCVVHTRYNHEASRPIRVAVVECCVTDEMQEGENWGQKLEVVDADFFDDECIVIILRAEDGKFDDKVTGQIADRDRNFQERHL